MTATKSRIIVVKDVSNAAGIASFIFGFVSIMFMAPIFVPLAVLFGIIAIASKQIAWGAIGLFCALIGFLTSPILMGLFGVASIAANYRPPNTQRVPVQESFLSPVQSRQEQQFQLAKERATQVKAIMDECRNKRLVGELETYAESAECSNSKIAKIYGDSNYPYMDLVGLLAAKRVEIAEKLDRNELTEAQAQVEYSQFLVHINDEALRRDKIKSQ